MKLWQSNTLAAVFCVLAVYGCSSDGDDDATAAGSGGKAGKGGTTSGGKGGTTSGGKGGTTSGGKGGTTSGGKGGTTGTTGGAGGESASGGAAATGGTTTTGGAPGTGGASGGEGGLGGEAGAAAVDVTGVWDIEEVIPSSQPFAGTYPAVFTLAETGDNVTGTALWASTATSTLTGTVHGRRIHLVRVDTGGFRATFDGRVSANGTSISGTGVGDPTSPGGNDSTYTWTADKQ